MKLHVAVLLALCLQVFSASGQTNDIQVITLDDAIKIAIRNNPGTLSDNTTKQLILDVKSTWYTWLFSINTRQVLNDYLHLVGDIDQVASFHYKSGNIEWIDQSSWLVKLARIKTQESVTANENEIAINKIRQLLLTDDAIAPSDTSLFLHQIDKTGWTENTGKSSALSDTPDDSVAAINQDFLKNQTIRIKQLELDGLFIRLQFFYSFGLPHAEAVLRVSGAKLKCEEIDYFEFVDQVTEAFNLKLEFLETLHNYNQCAIQLEYYAR